MRTFTVVPSFEGESAFFDLPDIGFQGDHLSFAILFNLTELVEHWPNILPSMIVTDQKGNTYIAPHTNWDSDEHIFTWCISSTETTYEGYLKCQLKCTSADDPETIVCMSRICQTRVYQSLEAATDPPEALQTWLDTLVQLGAEINAEASDVLESVETSRTNALTAQSAAEAAELAKNAAQQARNSTEQTAQIAVSAQDRAIAAQQRAQMAAEAAEASKELTLAAQTTVEEALEEMDADVESVRQLSVDTASAAETAGRMSTLAVSAKEAAEQARSEAVIAKGEAEVAQGRAENAETGALAAQRLAEVAQAAAETAQGKAEDAQAAAETAQGKSEDAQVASETARDLSEDFSYESKKWAIGKDKNDDSVPSTDPTYHKNAKYWSEVAEAAKDTIFDVSVSTAFYSTADESVTLVLGGEGVSNHGQGV